LSLAALGALAACNLAPPYSEPPSAVPERFDSQGDAPGARAATEIEWHEFFGDPQLKFLIGQALAHNRDLVASVARVEQVRALYRIQGAERLPQLSVGASATRSKTPLATLDPGLGPADASFTFNQYNVQAAVSSFELDFWGRVANLTEAARRRFLATVEAERALRLSLIANVAATYYAILAGREGVELAEHTLTARRYALEIAQLRLDAGVIPVADFEQAAILVSQAEAQLAELRRSTEQLNNRLMVLVGGPTGTPLPPGRSIADAGQLGTIAAGLPSDLLRRRPDILQAEQQLRAADADIGAARAAYFPRIALTGAFGYVSPEVGSLLNSSNQLWSLSGSLVQPIFDAGRRDAQVSQTQARREELVALYQRTVQTAFTEVSDALIARRRLQEQIAAQEQTVEAQQRLSETAELRYQNGIAIYLEVVDAKRNEFSAEQQLIQLRAAALQNGVSLYVALGGGA